jgi:hypothetical protein
MIESPPNGDEMHIFRSSRRSAFTLVLMAACCLGIDGLRARADNAPASTAPSTQSASGSVDLGDYCTLLLAPKVQDRLQFTSDQRDQAAKLKVRLSQALDVAVGGNTHMRLSPGVFAARAHGAMASVGKKVKTLLTPDQDKSLSALFDDGTLKPIEVESSLKHTGPKSGPNSHLVAGVEIIYTNYGEQNPTTQPAAHASNPKNTAAANSPSSNLAATSGDTAGRQTELIGSTGGRAFTKSDKANRPVIGFTIKIGSWAGHVTLRRVEPLYAVPSNLHPDGATVCIARDGYAVGGITVSTKEGADGMQVIFMKKTEKGLDPAASYTSDWFGYSDEGQKTKLAADGSIVIGIAGRQGMNMGALGLMTLPAGK